MLGASQPCAGEQHGILALQGAVIDQTPGSHPLDHTQIRYGEGWRVAGGVADPPQTGIAVEPGRGAVPQPGAPMAFSFEGRGVAFEIQGGEYWGYLVVTVDGEPANALPRDESGRSYLVLHDPSAATRSVTLAHNLPLGVHAVTVTPVNDPPTSTASGPTVAEDSGPRPVANWAAGRSAGPPDEAGQALTFEITGNTNAGLFSAGPVLDAATGNLNFTPAANVAGSAVITVVLKDNGGTADGGQDVSTPRAFTITVAEVNDPPVAAAGGPYTLAVGGSLTLEASASSDQDRDCGGGIALYRWDLDRDGTFDVDTADPLVTVPWSVLAAQGIENSHAPFVDAKRQIERLDDRHVMAGAICVRPVTVRH